MSMTIAIRSCYRKSTAHAHKNMSNGHKYSLVYEVKFLILDSEWSIKCIPTYWLNNNDKMMVMCVFLFCNYTISIVKKMR